MKNKKPKFVLQKKTNKRVKNKIRFCKIQTFSVRLEKIHLRHRRSKKLVQRASERRCRQLQSGCVTGAVDGELLAWRCRYMQKRGQVQCVRLLESRAKRGGVGGHFSGLEGMWGRGRGASVLLAPCGCSFLLSQTEFGSAHSFSLFEPMQPQHPPLLCPTAPKNKHECER